MSRKQRCETCNHPSKVRLNNGWYCFEHAQAVLAENARITAAVEGWHKLRGDARCKWIRDCEAIVRVMASDDVSKRRELVDLAQKACTSYDVAMAKKKPGESQSKS